jgi:general secretion pathway protein L
MNSVAGTLQSWREGATAFLQWWRDELWGLVPEPVRARVAGGETRTIVSVAASGMQVLEEAAGRARPLEPGTMLTGPEAVAEAVAEAVRTRTAGAPGRVGVRMPVRTCFKRSVELPTAARGDAGSILDLDLERSTPFKLKDVYTATYIDEASSGGGKIKAIQLVAKRETIDPLVAELRDAGVPVSFVDCWDEDGRSALPVDFLAARDGPQRNTGGLVTAPRVLAALVALLAVTAVVLALSRYQSALDEVQERAAETRTRAATVRRALESSDAAVAELTRLQRLKLVQIPATEIVEELTKLLPDSVWVVDLRLEGDVLDISGLAKSGAAVLPLFERSKLFAEAALTAPFTFDQQEDKERFSLRVRVRQPGAEPRTKSEEPR